MSDDLYIWVNRWDEFQTYQEKRGKKWTPPWIKTYPRQLDDERYYKLTDAQKLLLHELRLVFSSASLWVPFDTSWLCRKLGRKVRKDSIEALNHAGLITICSRTVLERFQDAFWNGSTLEVEVEVDKEQTPQPEPEVEVPSDNINFEPNGAGAEAFSKNQEDESNMQRQLREQLEARAAAGDLDTPIIKDETHYTIPPYTPEPLPERIVPTPTIQDIR